MKKLKFIYLYPLWILVLIVAFSITAVYWTTFLLGQATMYLADRLEEKIFKARGTIPQQQMVNEPIEFVEIEDKYVCLASDPENTINILDPDSPNWNMQRVREGLMSGMLRYATKQEVAAAIRDGLVKT